jgi:hypothetical protein
MMNIGTFEMTGPPAARRGRQGGGRRARRRQPEARRHPPPPLRDSHPRELFSGPKKISGGLVFNMHCCKSLLLYFLECYLGPDNIPGGSELRASVLSLSDYASVLLFIWRFVWGAV